MKNILIVDDDLGDAETTARMAKKILREVYKQEKESCVVEATTRSAHAFDILSRKNFEYSLAIIDMNFKEQEIQGHDLIKKIREKSNIPIIAYSGNPENKESAKAGGANAFLKKPFSYDSLKTILDKYFGYLKNQK